MTRRNDGASPPGRERAEQEIHGRGGGGQAEGGDGSRQNRQGSQRAETKSEGRTRGGFAAGSAPSEQGRGKPRPGTLAEQQAGLKARAGHHEAHGDRAEEGAQRGEPGGTHPRGGRQDVPGDRDPRQPS